MVYHLQSLNNVHFDFVLRYSIINKKPEIFGIVMFFSKSQRDEVEYDQEMCRTNFESV